MSILIYEKTLIDCALNKSGSVFEKIADSYEDDLLNFNYFPDDYFDFIIKLLSVKEYFEKPGVWNFLVVIGTEKDKLTSEHYCKLSNIIVNNYIKYLDEDLCLTVCDFVARNYSFDEAKSIFNKLEKIEAEKTENLRGFVVDGERIMMAESERRKND